MLAWVVINRGHRDQPHKSHAIRLFPSASFTSSISFISLISHLPDLLPSSVSPNPFVCHSYENCRGIHLQFPFWNITANAKKELSSILKTLPPPFPPPPPSPIPTTPPP